MYLEFFKNLYVQIKEYHLDEHSLIIYKSRGPFLIFDHHILVSGSWFFLSGSGSSAYFKRPRLTNFFSSSSKSDLNKF